MRLIGVLLIGLCASMASADERMRIVAVNYPLAYFTERLAVDLADVVLPVPQDVDPADWEPGADAVAEIQSADLIILNGGGYAGWTAHVSLPRARTLDTSRGFQDKMIASQTVTHSHGADGSHAHTEQANHFWLDPDLAILQAEAIAAALTRKAPEAGADIAARLSDLTADLGALDERAAGILAGTQRSLIFSHPIYQYFEAAYGIEAASLHWEPDVMPDLQEWETLGGLVSAGAAPVFVWEGPPSAEIANRLADTGLPVTVFSPLGNRPATGDYLSAMTEALAALEASLAPPS